MRLRLLTLLLALTTISSAHAAEIGHFSPAPARPRDFIMPEAGTYYLQYNTYYHASTYKNRHGDKVDTITTPNGPVSVDLDINSYVIAPMVAHVTKEKILGATYGFYVTQPFGNTGVGASLSSATRSGSVSDDEFNLGDTFVQPLWLAWDLPQGQVNVAYGVYAPTGKYDGDDTSNVGLGFWSHQFQANGAYYFDAHKQTALTTSLTYETHSDQKDADITPGDDMALYVGLDHARPMDEQWMLNFGAATYGQWQTTDDSGSDAFNPTVHDHVYGVGLHGGVVYLPWNSNIDFNWAHEFGAKDRLEGDYYTLTLSIPM